MNTPLQNRFETQLRSLTGFDFQDMVIKIFQMKYGETGFTDIRPQKDKGNDGIVESEKRIIACYGPEETQNTAKRQKDFEAKAKGDFEQYKTHWETQYPKWSIVINHKIDPQYDKIVKELSSNGTVIGLSQLLTIIDNLKNYQKRQLGSYLKIDKELFATDFLGEILEDMLKEDEDLTITTPYQPKGIIEIGEKILNNFNKEEIDEVKSEYESILLEGIFNQVNNLLYGYEDSEIVKIKRRIIYDYTHKSNGNFNGRLEQLTNLYLEKYSSERDDDYLYYVRGLLLYLFEQCLIGIKTQ
ncbi:MAG: hypothetical protein WD431_14445 [Cyclobacteriaceae bacterium]